MTPVEESIFFFLRGRDFARLCFFFFFCYAFLFFVCVCVTTKGVVVPSRIGMATFFLACVLGQLLASLILDHVGFLSLEEKPGKK